MSIDGYYHFDRVLPRHWEDEAKKSGYNADRALAHVRDLIARLPNEVRTLLAECKRDGSATADLNKLAKLLVERCAELAETYGAELMDTNQIRMPGF